MSTRRPLFPRLHLLELEDQDWLPAPIRDGATDFLETSQRMLNASALAAPMAREALEKSGFRSIVDLASGGGGPAIRLREHLAREGIDTDLVLTDWFPNRSAFEHAIGANGNTVRARLDRIDARDVPPELQGLRTLFNALHHFEPDDARAILADSVAARQPILVFELSERSVIALGSMVLVPLWVLLLTPTARPFRWSRLLFTYLLPAIPFVCLWDGVVSQLRSYHPSELLELASSADPGDAFVWRAGPLRRAPPHGSFLLGAPKDAESE